MDLVKNLAVRYCIYLAVWIRSNIQVPVVTQLVQRMTNVFISDLISREIKVSLNSDLKRTELI